MAPNEKQQEARADSALEDKNKPLHGEDLYQLKRTANMGGGKARDKAREALTERGETW